MQIRVNTQLTVADQGQPDLTISLTAVGPVAPNTHQTRVRLQSSTLTLWSAADAATVVNTLSFFSLHSDQPIDVELGADAPPPAVPAATPPFTWTVRVQPGAPLLLFSPLVMPGGLGTAPKTITRVRVQESAGALATLHFTVG